MATAVRKLENDDIRAIFESLHDNKPPPPGLDFKIVPVDSDGLRLSPPAHEYEGKTSVAFIFLTTDVRFRVRLTLNFICRQRWNLRVAQARQITDEEKKEEEQHKRTRRKAKDPTSSGPFGNENSTFQELYMEPEWTPISQANCNSAAVLLSSRKY